MALLDSRENLKNSGPISFKLQSVPILTIRSQSNIYNLSALVELF